MADSLLFDGVDDVVQYQVNESRSPTSWAQAWIIKRTDTGSNWRQFGYIAESGIGSKIGAGIDGSASGQLVVDIGSGQGIWTSGAGASLSDDGHWRLIVINNAGGANNMEASIYDYDDAAWDLTDDPPDSGGNPTEYDWNLGDALYIGSWVDNLLGLADFFQGNILAMGFWADTTLDSTTRDSLRFSLQGWIDAAPNIGYRFDSTSGTWIGTDTEPTNEATGGTVDTGDVPSGWSDALSVTPIEPSYSRFPKYKLRRS